MTILHIFIHQYPHDNIIDLLRFLILAKGANVNIRNSQGATAIHLLFLHYRHENLTNVANFFINYCSDITAKTPDGLTAFNLLCLN